MPTSFKKVRVGDRVVVLLKGSHGGRYTGKCESQGSGKMSLSATRYYTEDPKTGNLKRNMSKGDMDFVTEDVIGCWVIAEAKTSTPGQRIAARASQSRKRKVDEESEDEDEDEEEEEEEDDEEEERESVMEIPEEEAKEEEKERKRKKPAKEKHATKKRLPVRKSLYLFFLGMPAAQPWEPRPLAPLEARWDFGDELRKGRSLLEGTEDGRTPVAVWNFMFKPILEAMTLCLEEANRG